ncbi:hypothetical protein JYU34_004455 [Plutella xylostella]|uniref:Reverse transcriptase domain-containing protein n=1 Tax=Plutella xylostella TaxID=51655 RepID=A0ABQ7QY14_PLUXY|nr:hypothetical protein JYU34_004455 [Plutella xylostella]
MDWESVTRMDNIDSMVNLFNSLILQLYDLHAPEKQICIRDPGYPWITDNIKHMMFLRNEAFNRFKNTKLDSHKDYYLDLKRLVNSALHNEKRAYYETFINKNSNNSATLWKNLKNTVLRSHKDTDLPSHFNDPDAINKHFLDLPCKENINFEELAYFETNKFCDSIFRLKTVNKETVQKIINNLKSNAQGIDRITINMISLTLSRTLDIITFIINYSISTFTFPELWKIALIKPIPKTTCPSTYGQLRPISLLACLSKVLEKTVSYQMTQYIENNGILPSVQSGFRKFRSTSTALLDVVDNIIASQDRGKGTILTLLDFSRAFDTISVPRLLAKLSYYGFDADTVRWFYNYLNQRSQIVKLTNSNGKSHNSLSYPVTRGVPQGSILGPLLFVLYAADVVESIKNCKFHIYADDLQIYLSCTPDGTVDVVNKINHDLNMIVEWSKRNSLLLNPTKSKFLIIGSRKQIQGIKAMKPDIKVAGKSIEQVTEARNLGICFDSNLRFEKHILCLVSSCFYRLKVLYRIRPYINTDLRIKLCESLVLSKLNYADTVYGPCLYAKTQRLLQRVQNACARFCHDIPPRAHVTPFINNSGLLKIASRRYLHFACLLFGIVHRHIPEYLYDKLRWSRDFNMYRTRASSYLLLTPQHKTAIFKASFSFNATSCWNRLDPSLRNLKSVASFRSKLKRMLLLKQRSCW